MFWLLPTSLHDPREPDLSRPASPLACRTPLPAIPPPLPPLVSEWLCACLHNSPPARPTQGVGSWAASRVTQPLILLCSDGSAEGCSTTITAACGRCCQIVATIAPTPSADHLLRTMVLEQQARPPSNPAAVKAIYRPASLCTTPLLAQFPPVKRLRMLPARLLLGVLLGVPPPPALCCCCPCSSRLFNPPTPPRSSRFTPNWDSASLRRPASCWPNSELPPVAWRTKSMACGHHRWGVGVGVAQVATCWINQGAGRDHQGWPFITPVRSICGSTNAAVERAPWKLLAKRLDATYSRAPAPLMLSRS